jgi:hypothetical protein
MGNLGSRGSSAATQLQRLTLITNKHRQWYELGFDAWTLGFEASSVIALRTTNAWMGRDTDCREARLMVSEKMAAAIELQSALMSGKLGGSPAAITRSVLRSYTRKVRANRKRLR